VAGRTAFIDLTDIGGSFGRPDERTHKRDQYDQDHQEEAKKPHFVAAKDLESLNDLEPETVKKVVDATHLSYPLL
jgi:hypothetical protein